MERVTENVFTNTKIRGCNPSIVFTDEGAVFIDTAQWISTLLEMIDFAKSKGPIKYLINTEPHIDHIFGNHWFAGVCPVIGHEKLADTFFDVPGDMDGYDYSVDVLKRQDKEFLPFMPSREEYIVNTPQITFNDRMSLKVGNHTFNLYHTPGHADSQIAVYVPEEKVLFTGDTLFVNCQTWLHSANIDELISSLQFLKTLDIDYIVPGHGPVVGKEYIDVQLALIYKWISAVAEGVAKDWTLDKCLEEISFTDLPVDIGQGEMMDYIQKTNVTKCYNYIKN